MLDFPIVDSHIHLIDRARFSYSWSTGSPWATAAPRLNRSWTADDLTSYAKPYQVEGFVFVEADVDMPQYLAEAEWVAEMASNDSRIMGCVTCLPLEEGPAIESEMARIAALRPVRGIRRLIQNFSDSAIILQDNFVDGVNLLAKYNLSFDICIDHHQFENAFELIRRCPDVVFILDHIGKPDIQAGRFEPWHRHIREVSKLPNVVCKLSGVLTQANHATWTANQVLPYIAHVVNCFGVDRVLFGGDWPVLELASSYREWVDIVDQAINHLGASGKRKVFRDNAMRIYRLT